MRKCLFAGTSIMFSATLLAGLYGDTPDEKHAWSVHDYNRPKPAKVSVDKNGVPSDAIVLFDGTRESFEKNWCDDKGRPSKWQFSSEGYFYTLPDWKNGGGIFTREQFGDCQLHIEYRHDPEKIFNNKGPQMRGNSGVFLMGPNYGYEVQVLESYYTSSDLDGKPGFIDNYADGQAGSVYAENPPLVNPANKPGEWQVYDIVFHQPVWKDGKLVHAGSITVLFNGVLVQDHWEMEGQTTHCRRRPLKPHPVKGPLHLQDHGCVVQFRNIWYRPLASRWANTTHSAMSGVKEDVMALREKTAESLFAKIDFSAKDADVIVKLLEVISYSKSEKFTNACRDAAQKYIAKLDAMSDKEIKASKGDILRISDALGILNRNGVLPKECKLTAKIAAIKAKQQWK